MEWLVISFFTIFFLSYFFIKQHRPLVFWSLFRLLIVILVMQLALSGFQGSMVPLYGVVFILLGLSLKTLKIVSDDTPIKMVRRLLWGLAVALTLTSVIIEII